MQTTDNDTQTTSANLAPNLLAPQGCATCDTPSAKDAPASQPDYVYAIGRIQPRFPRVSVEKELAQATARTDTQGLTDRQAMHAVLSKPENRYLLRHLCWVLTIEGLETYILAPRLAADLTLLVDALRPAPAPTDVDVVIGHKGPIASYETCNGLMIPIVSFDQIYSFDREGLISAIPRPDTISTEAFGAAAAELFDSIMQMTDNAGNTDRHRALNYCAVRYPAIYAKAAERFGANLALSGVDVQPSPLAGVRKVVDVIFAFTHRATDVVEKYSVRVDVTDEFPFLVTKLSPYYDR